MFYYIESRNICDKTFSLMFSFCVILYSVTIKQNKLILFKLVSGQFSKTPPNPKARRKLPPVRVGVWVKVSVSFRVGEATRQLPPIKIVTQLGLGVELGLV